MTAGIRLTGEEMRFIALFESVTGAAVTDCILNEGRDRVIFIIKEGNVGMAIGKGGKNIRLLERMTNKKLEIIEYSDDPAIFIRNALKPARINEIRITEKPDGKSIAVVAVDPKDKGVAIGRNGRNAERIRLLAKRYFRIQNVSIT